MLADNFNDEDTKFITRTLLEFIQGKNKDLDYTLLIYNTNLKPAEIIEITSASDTNSKVASAMNAQVERLGATTTVLDKY